MTAVSIEPNEDIVGGHYADVIDGSDSTYAYIVRTFYTQMGLTTFTLPAGAWVKSGQIVARVANTGAGIGGSENDPVTAYVSLRDAAGNGYADWSFTISSAAPDNRVSATAPLLSGGAFGQAQLDDLRVWFWHIHPPHVITAAEYLSQMFHLRVDIVYATRPVVVTAGPSGTVLSATQTVDWTFTGDIDADAFGRQNRYYVRVFPEAVYDSGGYFDPDYSTPVYDSGEVVSDATAATIGPLPNLTTYKAYVRAAQSVNGVMHWSAWDDGPEFTTDTDPPHVATIVATPEAARVRIKVTRDLAHTDWTHISVERSDVDALHWRPVRGALTVPAPDDTVTVYDYEMPEGVPLRYRARGIIMSGATVLSQGDWKATSAPVTWSTAVPCGEWVRAPGDPAGAVFVELVVDEATTSTEHKIGLLDVIGRASPVTVWDTPSLPTGEMSVVTRTFTEAAALQDLLRSAPVLLYQGRYAWGHPYRWMAITNHTTSRQPSADAAFRDYRLWTWTYVEVDEPPVLA